MAALFLNEADAKLTARCEPTTGDIVVLIGRGIRAYLSVDAAHALVDHLQAAIRTARTTVTDLDEEQQP